MRRWGKARGTLPVPPKRKRPSDPNRAAASILAEHLARVQEPQTVVADHESIIREHMRKLGAKGGKVSGARRMDNLTDAQRSEIALKAATTRWDKERKKSRG